MLYINVGMMYNTEEDIEDVFYKEVQDITIGKWQTLTTQNFLYI